MKNAFFLIVVLFSISSFSQTVEAKKWKFAFQFDNRFSSIDKKEITIFGVKGGVQYKNLTRFGLGVSFILNPVKFEYFNKKMKVDETNNISFWYVSVFNDWIVYKDDRWECFITEQIGYGTPSFVREVNDEIVSSINIGLVVNEISAQTNYKVTSWVGLGAGVGYRNLWTGDARLKKTFNAPIYILKVIVYPEVFFKK